MLGMIIGGIISGMLGDRRGRVSVLFGSILLYSLANLANAWVADVNTYALIRFLAGLGLAGELGAGITLVSESMTIDRRGYGTILVATLGAFGAIAAGLAGDFLPWRTTYIVAGCAGLVLLFLRMTSLEPAMYKRSQAEQTVRRGSFRLLFNNRSRTLRYLSFIFIGVPVWYCVGMLINLSPELARQNGISGIRPITCFLLFQVGIACGDLSSGILSQALRTRKKILTSFLSLALLASIFFFAAILQFHDADLMLISTFVMGFGCGYLSVFVTTTAESFGTNLRVTVSATVTNFMRGAVTILIPLRIWLSSTLALSLAGSLILVGILVFIPAMIAAIRIGETYGKSLDYLEA
jgi:putative MFS transporter